MFEERLRQGLVQPGEEMTLGRPDSSLSLPMKRLSRRLICGGNTKGDRRELKRDVLIGKDCEEKLLPCEDGKAVEQVSHRTCEISVLRGFQLAIGQSPEQAGLIL